MFFEFSRGITPKFEFPVKFRPGKELRTFTSAFISGFWGSPGFSALRAPGTPLPRIFAQAEPQIRNPRKKLPQTKGLCGEFGPHIGFFRPPTAPTERPDIEQSPKCRYSRCSIPNFVRNSNSPTPTCPYTYSLQRKTPQPRGPPGPPGLARKGRGEGSCTQTAVSPHHLGRFSIFFEKKKASEPLLTK